MKKVLLLLPILAVSFFILSCKKDKVPQIIDYPIDLCADTVSFSQVVQPLIEQGCATTGCHDPNHHQAGYNFTGYQNISSSSSSMISSIRHDAGLTPMPYNQSKFADSLIQKIECWIAQGKLNN